MRSHGIKVNRSGVFSSERQARWNTTYLEAVAQYFRCSVASLVQERNNGESEATELKRRYDALDPDSRRIVDALLIAAAQGKPDGQDGHKHVS